jgi:hypothetical protein
LGPNALKCPAAFYLARNTLNLTQLSSLSITSNVRLPVKKPIWQVHFELENHALATVVDEIRASL